MEKTFFYNDIVNPFKYYYSKQEYNLYLICVFLQRGKKAIRKVLANLS